MSTLMEDDIKRWTAKRKTALVLDIIQGKTTISEASRAFDLNPSEVEQWVEHGAGGAQLAELQRDQLALDRLQRQHFGFGIERPAFDIGGVITKALEIGERLVLLGQAGLEMVTGNALMQVKRGHA